MKTIIAVSLAVAVLTGCATRQKATEAFYVQEDEAARICLAPVIQMPLEDRYTVDQRTGRSPLSNAAWCYSNQIRTAVRMTSYPHAALVGEYADFLIQLTGARDRGIITTPIALEAYQQTSTLFRQSITNADARLDAQARRELGENIAVFAVAMGAVAAEQDRQRMANRPVVCTLTGIYVQNTVVCH